MSRFLSACRRRPTDVTPVWFMRQAGRYMREFREIRAKHSLLEICKNPDLATEVTLQPMRLGVDAAIIFADILLPLEPMGIDLEFAKGEGPVIHNPVRTGEDVRRLQETDARETLGFVGDAIRLVRKELGDTPLIGFSGAPFTLASYAIEGGHSKNYLLTKGMMYEAPEIWHLLLSKFSRAVAEYLSMQIAAGAQAVQLFDSWVGALSPEDYRRYVLPYTRFIFEAIGGEVPAIHFGTGTAGFLELMAQAGGEVIGIDWRIPLDEAWRRLGDVAIQGNLDPAALFAPRKEMEHQVTDILRRASGRPGHIFNLGHGILPGTPVENVAAVVEIVHQFKAEGGERKGAGRAGGGVGGARGVPTGRAGGATPNQPPRATGSPPSEPSPKRRPG